MLSDIVIVRSAVGADRMDLHRSATFRCRLAAGFRRFAAMIGIGL